MRDTMSANLVPLTRPSATLSRWERERSQRDLIVRNYGWPLVTYGVNSPLVLSAGFRCGILRDSGQSNDNVDSGSHHDGLRRSGWSGSVRAEGHPEFSSGLCRGSPV